LLQDGFELAADQQEPWQGEHPPEAVGENGLDDEAEDAA
jgi:hypothetical protein